MQTLRIILAKSRGFCAGVVRAIDTVEVALQHHASPVYVRHEIVHNKHVVDDLKLKGARFVEELEQIPDGAVTIFSAHGVARSVAAEARRRGLLVLDATCPMVAKVHAEARRYAGLGRDIVLVGHAGHAEVIGTLGQTDRPMYLIASVADVARLPLQRDAPVAYVTQTTLSLDDTQAIIAALKARFSDIIGPAISDICYATQNRQRAVRSLCVDAQLLLVVGAANSSNANRLVEIGRECGRRSYIVADGSDIDSAWLDGIDCIGLTAGASAPEALVQDVIAALRRLRNIDITHMSGTHETIEFRLPAGLRN